jgi:hypothetical protein
MPSLDERAGVRASVICLPCDCSHPGQHALDLERSIQCRRRRVEHRKNRIAAKLQHLPGTIAGDDDLLKGKQPICHSRRLDISCIASELRKTSNVGKENRNVPQAGRLPFIQTRAAARITHSSSIGSAAVKSRRERGRTDETAN